MLIKAEIIEKIKKLSGFRPSEKELKKDLEQVLEFAQKYQSRWRVENYLEIIKELKKIDFYSGLVFYKEA